MVRAVAAPYQPASDLRRSRFPTTRCEDGQTSFLVGYVSRYASCKRPSKLVGRNSSLRRTLSRARDCESKGGRARPDAATELTRKKVSIAFTVWTSAGRGASIWARCQHGDPIMKKFSMLGIIGGAALLAAVPFSLQWSQVGPAVPLLTLSQANAQYYGPYRRHVRRVYRRAYRRAYYGYPYSYGGYSPYSYGGYSPYS